MLQSQPVAGDAVHRRCWERVLDGYLFRRRPPVPATALLLNDLIRYWRTICIDFVGKDARAARSRRPQRQAADLAQGPVRRRPLPLLQSHRFGRDERRAYLAAQLAAPATDRLAGDLPRLRRARRRVRALSAYDR